MRLDRIFTEIEDEEVPLDELTGLYRRLKHIVTRRRKVLADKAPIPRVLKNRSAYKVKLSKVAPAEARSRLAADYPRCVLDISLGMREFEGERLESLLGWINGTFEQCQVLVGDSLYRLTLRLREDASPDEARSQARRSATSWVERNRPLIERFQECRFEVRLISELESHPRRMPVEKAVRRLYDRDKAFRRSVNAFSRDYCRHVLARGETGPQLTTAETEIGRRYLIEELGFFGALAGEDWNVIFYPGNLRTFVEIAAGRFTGLPSALKKLVYCSLSQRKRGISFHDQSDYEEDLTRSMT